MNFAITKTLLLGFMLTTIAQQIFAQDISAVDKRNITLLEAVQSTLMDHPRLRFQGAQVLISRGLKEVASGAFNATTTAGFNNDREVVPLTTLEQQDDATSGIFGVERTSNAMVSGIGIQRLLRNGIQINSQFQLSRVTDNIFDAGGLNTSSLSFSLNIPLLRGRGRENAGSQEMAAKRELDATLSDLNQLIVQLVSNTASSYWNLVAARNNLAIASDAEARGNQYLTDVRTLAEADHVPRNDLHELVANLAAQTSVRLAAEQQVLAAQQQLALDMGVGAERLSGNLPLPSDDIPNAEDQPLPSDSPDAMRYYMEQALQNRSDYMASLTRVRETRGLFNAAQNQLLPQVNLNLGAGYAGLTTGRQPGAFFSSSYGQIQGPNVIAGLTYTFSRTNQVARGQLMQANGVALQNEAQNQDLARTISASVAVAVEAVRSAILRVKKSRESVESFHSALAGEREKYAGGIGSIVSILTVEDKLTAALSDQVQAELAYALALTQFRFATGTLIKPNQINQDIHADVFVTVPFTNTPQGRQ
jgi:outer membrane protein